MLTDEHLNKGIYLFPNKQTNGRKYINSPMRCHLQHGLAAVRAKQGMLLGIISDSL